MSKDITVTLTSEEVDALIRASRKVDAWVITRSARGVEPSQARSSARAKLIAAETAAAG